jgi:hypothetical protein
MRVGYTIGLTGRWFVGFALVLALGSRHAEAQAPLPAAAFLNSSGIPTLTFSGSSTFQTPPNNTGVNLSQSPPVAVAQAANGEHLSDHAGHEH